LTAFAKQAIITIMPRTARKVIFNESNYCHVLVQGIAKEYLFESARLKGFYLKCLSEKRAEHNVSILAFCIMGNHAHILLTAERVEAISLYVKSVNTTYAKFYNKISKRVGFVFRNRFRAEAIKDETYLLRCIGYIHNNPIKAGIVDIAEKYEFSSANNYKTRQGIIDFTKLSEIYGEIPRNIQAEEGFIDDKLENSDKTDEILTEIVKKYGITSKNSLKDDDLLGKVAVELKERTGASLREIAGILELCRERVRRAVSSFTSP